jgi:hypothetical protein
LRTFIGIALLAATGFATFIRIPIFHNMINRFGASCSVLPPHTNHIAISLSRLNR